MIYTTIQGDTWDKVSRKIYGSDFHTTELFNWNTGLQHVAIFDSGNRIYYEELDDDEFYEPPPWLRGDIETEDRNTELLDLMSTYRPDIGKGYLSYRFVERYTLRMTEYSKWEGIK